MFAVQTDRAGRPTRVCFLFLYLTADILRTQQAELFTFRFIFDYQDEFKYGFFVSYSPILH